MKTAHTSNSGLFLGLALAAVAGAAYLGYTRIRAEHVATDPGAAAVPVLDASQLPSNIPAFTGLAAWWANNQTPPPDFGVRYPASGTDTPAPAFGVRYGSPVGPVFGVDSGSPALLEPTGVAPEFGVTLGSYTTGLPSAPKYALPVYDVTSQPYGMN
jgi:hypothetical protein